MTATRIRAARVPMLGLLALMLAASASAGPVAASTSSAAPEVDDTALQAGDVPRLDASKIGPATKRCGWWDNPTPGNAWLTDRDGAWTVAMQGMYEAAGDWPQFEPGQVAPREAPHGHGCACILARVDTKSRFVYSFTNAQPLALKVCRADPKLKGREPKPR